MSVRVTDNTPLVYDKVRTSSALFIRFLLDDVQRYSDPITPMREGRLRQGVLKQVLGLKGVIMWVKEYAAAQEVGTTRGHPITHYTTPGTNKEYAQKGVNEAVRNAEATMKKAELI